MCVQQGYCEGGGSRGEKSEEDFLATLLPDEHLFGSGGLREDLVGTATYWPLGSMGKNPGWNFGREIDYNPVPKTAN